MIWTRAYQGTDTGLDHPDLPLAGAFMIVVRALAFLMFLAMALALAGWQVLDIHSDLDASAHAGRFALLLLGMAVLAAEVCAARLAPEKWRRALTLLGGLPVLPLTALVAGIFSAIQARGGSHRRIWDAALLIGALVGLNVLLPLACSQAVVGGSEGLGLGWMTIKAEFFLVVDYFLGRALVHYFNSGASAFVSLRYLRKRVISLLSVAGIAVGVWLLILVNSVMSGFQADFKEQVRGSLSHLLVRFDGDRFHLSEDSDKYVALEWAEYVRRINANADTRRDWEAALEQALQRFAEADGDALSNPRDITDTARAQPAEPEQPAKPDATSDPQRTERQNKFLDRLRTGKNLSDFDRECLRDGGRIVTPREFYLSRSRNAAEAEEQARKAWYGPLFRQRLQDEFDATESALKQHLDFRGKPDVLGVSWRVSTKTFITPSKGNRDLPFADLVGVDPGREPDISNLGNYVAAAEVQTFKDRHVLMPLLNLLGTTLGWETDESLEALSAQPSFMFTENNKNTGRMAPDLRNMLARRKFVTGTGTVLWPMFDRVRYQEFSPGQQLYERLKTAHKAASRTDDMNELRGIVQSCHRDVGAILDRFIKVPATKEPAILAARNGSAIILREYLTGSGLVHDAIARIHAETYLYIKDYLNDSSLPPLDTAERAGLTRLWQDIDAATKTADAVAMDLEKTEAAREEALAAMVAQYAKLLQATISQARQGRWPSLELLRQIDALQPAAGTTSPMQAAMKARQPVPLAFALENFDTGADFARQRMEAYRKVLPLRTTMQPGDSAQDYFKRAKETGRHPNDGVNDQGAEPGLILGDALAESAILGGVKVGDVVEVTIPRIYFDENGRPQGKASQVKFRITALFRSGLYEDNLGRMYCDFDELAATLSDSEVRYYVGAKLADYSLYEGTARADKLKTEVRALLEKTGVRPSGVSVWEDEKRSLLEAVEREKLILGLIVSFIIVLVGFLILMLVYQLVNEKVKDIGIIKALGFSPWGVRSVFMFNALFIGLFGALIGAAMGFGCSEYLNEIEDLIDQVTGVRLFPPEVYFLTYIPSVKGAALLRLSMNIAAPVVLFSFGCGILPATMAARKDPVEALHYE